MKPSEKAIEAVNKVWREEWDIWWNQGNPDWGENKPEEASRKMIQRMIETYNAIDVDPLLAEKDREIERLTEQLRLCNIDQINAEQRIAELEAELRTQQDECSRFHKPA